MQGCWKSKIHQWPQRDLKYLNVKSTLCTLCTHEARICVRFALRPAVFKIQGRCKSEVSRMTPDWPWTLNSQTYPIYIKWVSLRPKFVSVLLYDFGIEGCWSSEHRTEIPQSTLEHFINKYLEAQSWSVFLYDQSIQRCRKSEKQKCTEWPQTDLEHLTVKSTPYKLSTPDTQILSILLYNQSRYHTFHNYPLTIILNCPEKNKKLPKIPNLKFHNSLNNFGRDPPQEYAWFVGVNLMCTLRGAAYGIFTPIWSHVNINNSKETGLEMWWAGSFPQNLALIRLTASENKGFVDGRRTPAWRQ